MILRILYVDLGGPHIDLRGREINSGTAGDVGGDIRKIRFASTCVVNRKLISDFMGGNALYIEYSGPCYHT